MPHSWLRQLLSFFASMHLPFPGIGRVRAEGNGVYSWVPVKYTPIK